MEAKKLNQNTNPQSLGCGAIVVLVAVPTFLLATCSSQPEPTLRDQIRTVRSDISDKKREISGVSPKCASVNKPKSPAQIREDSFAEFDIAIAENIDDATPAQEKAIRELLGAELGMHPSQVDGWKQIYKSRAENAQRQQRLRQYEAEREQENWDYERELHCDKLKMLKTELEVMKSNLQTLKDKRDKMRASAQESQ
jgi:hypothetical protein